MQLRNKYYPYPVIGNGSNWYQNDTFVTQIDDLEKDINGFRLTVHNKLKCRELEELIRKGSVAYACHVECGRTSFRRMFTSFLPDWDILLDNDQINDKVEVCTFLVALKDVPLYTYKDCPSDQPIHSFFFQRGFRLGIGQRRSFIVEKQGSELTDRPSIFAVSPDFDSNRKEARIDIDDDNEKIVIVLPKKMFENYSALIGDREKQQNLYSQILIPALMQVFFILKESGPENYAEKRWYQSLDYEYRKIKHRSLAESLAAIDPFQEAQKWTQGALRKSLEQMISEADN